MAFYDNWFKNIIAKRGDELPLPQTMRTQGYYTGIGNQDL